MKKVPTFHTKSETSVNAYDPKDLPVLQNAAKIAEDLWFEEWKRQGSTDNGTCCGGKGIEVWYVGPRKRCATPINLVKCSWVQGNLSASRSVAPALEFLKSQGIEAEYNDGWMD